MFFPRFLTISLVVCVCLSLLPAATALASSKIRSFEEASAVTDQRVLAQILLNPSEVLDSYYNGQLSLYEYQKEELHLFVLDRLKDRDLLLEIASAPDLLLKWRKAVLERLDDEGLAAYVRQANERVLTGWFEYRHKAMLTEAIESIESPDLLESLAAETEDRDLYEMLVSRLRYEQNGAAALARLRDRFRESKPNWSEIAAPKQGLLRKYGPVLAIGLLLFGAAAFLLYRLTGNEGESVLLLLGVLFFGHLAFMGWTGVAGISSDLDFRRRAQPVIAKYSYMEISSLVAVTKSRYSGREISREGANTPHWRYEEGGVNYCTDVQSAYIAAKEGLKARVARLKYASDHNDLLDYVREVASEAQDGRRDDTSFEIYCVPGEPGNCRLTKDMNLGNAFMTGAGALAAVFSLGWLAVLIVNQRRRLGRVKKGRG